MVSIPSVFAEALVTVITAFVAALVGVVLALCYRALE